MSHFNLQTAMTQVEQPSISQTNQSLLELLYEQQTLQRNTTAVITRLSELQTQHKNVHFLTDL